MDEHQAEVEWRPYYLRPDMPPDGIELPDYKKRQIEEMKSRLTHMAGAAGLEIVFATRIPNTRLAHEATEYARDKGKHFEFHRSVFDRFYGKGDDIGTWHVLRDISLEVGLDADEMQQEVESGKYTARVTNMVSEAQEIGVTSVPTYVLNNRYSIIGAQQYEVFLQALEQIEQEKTDQA